MSRNEPEHDHPQERQRPSSPSRRPRYIVVEGPIGVGKTTLTRMLAARLGARAVYEVVEENPFLPLFYQNREKYAFQTQIFFLLSRFKQQQELFQQELFRQGTVSDYLFAKDRLFASLTLSPAELALYDRIFEELRPRVMKPDLVVYLRADLNVLLARIRKRARSFEASFDADYLARLCETYNQFFARYDETPLLIADTSEIDMETHPQEYERLIQTAATLEHGVVHFGPPSRLGMNK